MTAARPRVLVYGSFAAQGVPCGVTAAVDGFLASPIRRLYDLDRISTRNDAGGDRGLASRLAHGSALFVTALRTMLRTRADLVDIHAVSGREFLKNAAVMLAARLLRRPVVLRIHGGDFDKAMDLGVPGARQLVRWLLRRPQRVVVLSKGWADRIRALEPRAVVGVVPNSIDGHVYGEIAERRQPGAEDILLLGNLCERKGHFDALEALAQLRASHPNSNLLFAGAERDAGARAALEKHAEDLGIASAVQFLGPVFGKEKDETFCRAGVLILPSHVENMPLSIMEGMAAALPVIASRVGATPEMIDDGADGFLIEPHDSDALAERVRLVLDDPELRRELGERGRAKALERWDRRAVAERTAALYAELLS